MGVREVNIRPTISFVGDSGSGGRPGAVPAPAGGDAAANKFLKANATWETPAGGGDVTAAANIPDNAIVRGDGGAKGVQGDVELTFLDGLLSILVTVSLVDNRGLKLKNDNSIVAPDGWAITPGAPGIFDGNLMISSDPTDFLNNVSVRFLPGGATAFVTGASVGDDKAFRSETAGALAYFQPRDTIGRQRTILSGVGEDGGTGHEGLISFDVYAFGDSGLQLTGIADFVVDADYRAHCDFFSLVLLKGTGILLAGETGFTRNLVTGLQLQGQGSTNDVTIYNDAHEPVIEIPTGTKNVKFAGNIRPAGTVELDKGADIASAATLILGSDGNSFKVTGTTTITAISAKPIGTRILLEFDDVARLTHNATALDLQGNVDMVPETRNTIGLHCYDGTNWREIYRNDGQQVRVSGSIADQAMVRGNGGAKRIQDTGNFIGDDNEILMAGQDQWKKGADIATAAALTIGVDGNLKHMTGSVGVTSINAIRTGVWVALVADGAPLFTHSASLILAGAVNFQMVAGNVLVVVDEGGGIWREISRNVAPVGGGTYRRGHTYAITGEVKVPSGETDFLIPFFVDIAPGETKNIVKATYKINGGTSVTCKIQKNDVDITGFTGISVTTTKASTDPADVVLAAEDKLALVVTAVAGAPTNMSFTIFIEETR